MNGSRGHWNQPEMGMEPGEALLIKVGGGGLTMNSFSPQGYIFGKYYGGGNYLQGK